MDHHLHELNVFGTNVLATAAKQALVNKPPVQCTRLQPPILQRLDQIHLAPRRIRLDPLGIVNRTGLQAITTVRTNRRDFIDVFQFFCLRRPGGLF